MTIGERIKFRCEELGMSQEELAHKIGYRTVRSGSDNTGQKNHAKCKIVVDNLRNAW